MEEKEIKRRSWHPNTMMGTEIIFLVPENYCVFCKHCSDVFWDCTNGPYMCFCDLEPNNNDYRTCDKFEEDKDE